MSLPHLLCVDDDATVRLALIRLLSSHFTVLAAGDTQEARVLLSRITDLSIVLTDEVMPGESGHDFLATVQKQFPTATRAILSGHLDLETIAHAINSGRVHRVFLKPWDNDYLLIQMTEALQEHHLLNEKSLLETLAVTDPVTLLKNHRYFQDRVAIEIERSQRHGRPVSLLMADVDHFKAFNDQFGHPAGDVVLREVGQLITRHVRTIDTVARYGGEEFAVILPDTEFSMAMRVAERVRLAFTKQDKTFVTLSVGVASFPDHAASKQTLVDAADRALYKAKRQGRNQSVGASESGR